MKKKRVCIFVVLILLSVSYLSVAGNINYHKNDDWGDGMNSGWLGPNTSGVTVEATHTWSTKGNYAIKVKAKDIYGNERVWSDLLPVTMPQYKIIMPEARIWFLRGIFKFIDEDDDYVYEEVINATLIGLGPGFYTYGLSHNIPIKIMKPFYGFMPRGSLPFLGIGVCRHWEYIL